MHVEKDWRFQNYKWNKTSIHSRLSHILNHTNSTYKFITTTGKLFQNGAYFNKATPNTPLLYHSLTPSPLLLSLTSILSPINAILIIQLSGNREATGLPPLWKMKPRVLKIMHFIIKAYTTWQPWKYAYRHSWELTATFTGDRDTWETSMIKLLLHAYLRASIILDSHIHRSPDLLQLLRSDHEE